MRVGCAVVLLFMTTDAITYERRLEILQRMRPDIASALTTFSVGIKKYLDIVL